MDVEPTTWYYSFDNNGNLREITSNGTNPTSGAIRYSYDAANRLINAGGVRYTQNANGNLLNDGSATYGYGIANRLISATVSGVNTQCAYNGDGARLRQIVEGALTTHTLDLAAPTVQAPVQQGSSGDTRHLYGVTWVGEQGPGSACDQAAHRFERWRNRLGKAGVAELHPPDSPSTGKAGASASPLGDYSTRQMPL